MRFHWRPLIPGESDPELLWGSVLTASALVATGWLHVGLPTPLCPLHAVTGLPCPTCGMTRAVASLLKGNFVGAMTWNPLSTLVLVAAALYALYAAVVVIAKLPRLRWTPPSRSESHWIRIGVILLFAINWGYLIWRGV